MIIQVIRRSYVQPNTSYNTSNFFFYEEFKKHRLRKFINIHVYVQMLWIQSI